MNKVAVITGASRGIGAATAIRLVSFKTEKSIGHKIKIRLKEAKLLSTKSSLKNTQPPSGDTAPAVMRRSKVL